MINRKTLTALIFMALVCLPLCAAPRFFIGANFNYDANMLSDVYLDRLEGLPDDVYNGGNISGLHAVGPRFELIIFPFSSIPAGLGVTSTTMLNVGYMGGGSGSYFSYKFDFRQDLGLNFFFQKSFSSTWGLFADLGLMYSWYRIATENKANSKADVEYIRFTNWGVSADFGVYLENKGSFFKVGATLYYDLENMSDFAFRYGLTLGGGVTLG